MIGFDIAIAVLEGATNVREVAEADVATSTVLRAAIVAGKTVDSRSVEGTGRNPAQGAAGSVVPLLSSLAAYVYNVFSAVLRVMCGSLTLNHSSFKGIHCTERKKIERTQHS